MRVRQNDEQAVHIVLSRRNIEQLFTANSGENLSKFVVPDTGHGYRLVISIQEDAEHYDETTGLAL